MDSRKQTDIGGGLSFRVDARIRSLRDTEVPLDAVIEDHRMVEYHRSSGKPQTAGPRPPRLVHGPSAVGIYSPLRELGLLEDFTQLFGNDQLPSDGEIMDFYRAYGPLRDSVVIEGRSRPAWLARISSEARTELIQDTTTQFCEPLWWLHERGREVRLTHDIYVLVRDREYDALRQLFGAVPAAKRVVGISILAGRIVRDLVDEADIGSKKPGSVDFEEDEAGLADTSGRSRALSDDECAWLGTWFVAQQLNIGETGSRRHWDVALPWAAEALAKPGELLGKPSKDALDLVRVRSADSLTAAMYLQLGEAVEEHVLLRACRGCRRLFYPKRIDQQYCDAHCGDAARQRRYYLARAKRKPATRRRQA